MQSKTISTALVALIIGIAVGYFVPHGAPSKPQTGFAGRANGSGSFARGGFTRGGTNGGMLAGTVVSISGQEVTIKTPDGSSHIVLMTPNTTVSKSVAGSVNDLTSGTSVLVSGTPNTDGSLSANLIQLRPVGARTGAPMVPAQ